MPLKSIFMKFAVFAALSSCSTTHYGTQADDPVPPSGKLYGEYLAGAYASEIAKPKARSENYAKAYARMQGDVYLGREAVMAAIQNGDWLLARTLSRELLAEDRSSSEARIVLASHAFSKGDYAGVLKYTKTRDEATPMQAALDILEAWTHIELGDYASAEQAIIHLDELTYFSYMGDLMRGKIATRQGQRDKAKQYFKNVTGRGVAPSETRRSQARLLIEGGEENEALELLETYSKDLGGLETGPVVNMIAALSKGEAVATQLSPTQEASIALVEPSLGYFTRRGEFVEAEAFLRLAQLIDPQNDKAKVWLATLLEPQGREDEARNLFKQIDLGSPYKVDADMALANYHFRKEEDDKALAILEKSYAENPIDGIRESLALARRIREDYAAALPIYDELIAERTAEEIKEDTSLLYYRGICYERIGQWDKAVVDFKRVLSYEPEHADALNYLGYTWVDRGENLHEAFEMIRTAARLEPRSGAITDSLGWAHYKLGEYNIAKKHLEKAVELSPSSATIVDHLGDVYWKLGRKREAGYQWERALEFDPTDKERINIKLKLKGGLEAVKAE